MIIPAEPEKFLKLAGSKTVIDVRSPGEFAQGHIPGAISIPIFEDAERAAVGTLYVKRGRDEAIMKGLDVALPKTGIYLKTLGKIVSPPGEILLHCWRGGLRSSLMAEVYSKAGYTVSVLTGGYKAYRGFIREDIALTPQIVVLGGFTGSGKTDLLHAIAKTGEQVVDLEGLACHKGSAFGALGQPAQPTNEQFENDLYARLSALDRSRRIWVEDESRMIGKITLPDPVVSLLANGRLIRVELDMEIRIARLVKEYAQFDNQLLCDSINRIAARLGGEKAKEAITAIENSEYNRVARIVLTYYDKAYLFATGRRKNTGFLNIPITGGDHASNAARIIELADKSL
jgi:tRNA 2-selenouridine synthase